MGLRLRGQHVASVRAAARSSTFLNLPQQPTIKQLRAHPVALGSALSCKGGSDRKNERHLNYIMLRSSKSLSRQKLHKPLLHP